MPTIFELLARFGTIGLFSIGGGYATIPLIYQSIVEKAGWLSAQEFTDIITISQMTPGPLAVNTSTFVGIRIAGLPGAIVATLGCVACGFLISVMLYRFMRRHKSNPTVARILDTLKAASVGLIAAAGATILMLALFGTTTLADLSGMRLRISSLFLMAFSLAALRKWRINPIWIMLMTGAAGALFL